MLRGIGAIGSCLCLLREGAHNGTPTRTPCSSCCWFSLGRQRHNKKCCVNTARHFALPLESSADMLEGVRTGPLLPVPPVSKGGRKVPPPPCARLLKGVGVGCRVKLDVLVH